MGKKEEAKASEEFMMMGLAARETKGSKQGLPDVRATKHMRTDWPG